MFDIPECCDLITPTATEEDKEIIGQIPATNEIRNARYYSYLFKAVGPSNAQKCRNSVFLKHFLSQNVKKHPKKKCF